MKLAKLSMPKSKFGSDRANKFNSGKKYHQNSSASKARDQEEKATTFTEKRADDLQKRYQKSLQERNKMLRGQFATNDSLENIYSLRKDILDRKIDRIEDEMRQIKQDQDQTK